MWQHLYYINKPSLQGGFYATTGAYRKKSVKGDVGKTTGQLAPSLINQFCQLTDMSQSKLGPLTALLSDKYNGNHADWSKT